MKIFKHRGKHRKTHTFSIYLQGFRALRRATLPDPPNFSKMSGPQIMLIYIQDQKGPIWTLLGLLAARGSLGAHLDPLIPNPEPVGHLVYFKCCILQISKKTHKYRGKPRKSNLYNTCSIYSICGIYGIYSICSINSICSRKYRGK